MRPFGKLALAALLAVALAEMAAALEIESTVAAEAGLGYDSNAFLTPDSTYFDGFAEVLVEPDRQSGFFAPYAARGNLSLSHGCFGWLTSARAEGRSYLESDLRNADSYKLGLDTGVEYVFSQRGRAKDRIYFGPMVSYNKEIYFDRDTGLDKTTRTTGENLSNRFNYFQYGLEAKLRARTSPIKYELHAEMSKYDYESVPVISPLDHTYYLVGAEGEYRFFGSTNVQLGYDYYVRDYDDRKARNRDGRLPTSNPELRYVYHNPSLSVRHDLTSRWTLYAGYDLLLRDDQHVGYNDYAQNRIRGRAKYEREEGQKLELELIYWDRDYPRAFAFDDPAFSRKSYTTWEAKAQGELPITGIWRLWAEAEHLAQDAEDPRYAYDRQQVLLGIRAEL